VMRRIPNLVTISRLPYILNPDTRTRNLAKPREL